GAAGGHAASGGRARERACHRPCAPPPAEERAEHGARAGQHLGRLPRPRVRLELLDAPLGLLEGAVEAVALRLETVPDLRGLGVRTLLRGGVAALGEVLRRLTRAGDELELAVPLELERTPLDEPVADLLRSRLEERVLRDGRARQHVDGVCRRRGCEIALVVVDLRLAVEVDGAVERAVDRLELLLLVDACRAVVVAERDAGCEKRTQA